MAKKVKKKAVAKKKVTKKKTGVAKKSTSTKQRLNAGTKTVGDTARVDAYIAQAPEYAQPILRKIRSLFHKGCPRIEEKIKWGVPHFDYKGMLGGIAAFKNHVSFGFWKSELIKDTHGLFDRGPKASMCTVKVTSLKDMPPDNVMLSYIAQAVELNDAGAKKVKAKKAPTKAPTMPADLKALLAKNKKAAATFEGFPPSHKREYIEWIVEAKRDETRQKRLATAIEWMTDGKSRNWKYMGK